MSDRAADRSAVPHLLVGDQARRVRGHAQFARLCHIGMGRQRADLDAIGRLADPAQVGQLPQVHQKLRRGEPQLHER